MASSSHQEEKGSDVNVASPLLVDVAGADNPIRPGRRWPDVTADLVPSTRQGRPNSLIVDA
jgi:hypothetical protein